MKFLLILIKINFCRKIVLLSVIFLAVSVIIETNSFAAVVYQDFEPSNGTPPNHSAHTETPEYGWAFGEAAAGITQEGHPVHSGAHSWRVAIPDAETLKSGTGIAAMAQTYDMNFIPACFDRLSFWIWSEPLHPGAHTVMVKFFDHGVYHENGVGIWTLDKATQEQWTKLSILFSQLPKDFDLSRVYKIEFFNYWNGIYYYDDIAITSPDSDNEDTACLEAEGYVACQFEPLARNKGENPCVSVYSEPSDAVLDYMLLQGENQLETFHALQQYRDEILK